MTQKQIKVEGVTKVKNNAKGRPFVSVKDGENNWWYVGDTKLFSLFKKGDVLDCVVSTENDFKKIEDVISDDLGIVPTAGQVKAGQEDYNFEKRVISLLEEIKEAVQK